MSFYIVDKNGKYFVGLLIDCERTIIEFRKEKNNAFVFATFTRAFDFVRFISKIKNVSLFDYEVVKG